MFLGSKKFGLDQSFLLQEVAVSSSRSYTVTEILCLQTSVVLDKCKIYHSIMLWYIVNYGIINCGHKK
jgi:hypothetical protein